MLDLYTFDTFSIILHWQSKKSSYLSHTSHSLKASWTAWPAQAAGSFESIIDAEMYPLF